MSEFKQGDEALCTTRAGMQFKAVYTLAPGIDYFWNPVEDIEVNYLFDPVVKVERCEHE